MRNEDSVYALERHAQHPDESVLYAVDFTRRLAASGEELTGTPTITIDPSGPTLSEKSVNTTTTTNGQGEAVAAYKSALVRVAGLTAPQDYVLTVTCDTTTGNTLTIQCALIGQE